MCKEFYVVFLEFNYWPVCVVVKDIGMGGLGFNSLVGQQIKYSVAKGLPLLPRFFEAVC